MVDIIVIIMGIALLLYVLLGGADFGAGIIELFTGKRGLGTISRAIAPVWEANHVWLILIVVILFMGFPEVYTSITTVLHIPLLLVLLGIIFRGTAFAFRYYDIDRGNYKNIYSAFFRYSSLFTPFFLGVSLGAIILGRITLDYSLGFYVVFLAPWLNLFCFAMGVFILFLFSFLASVYLVGEADDDQERQLFVRLSKRIYLGLISGRRSCISDG